MTQDRELSTQLSCAEELTWLAAHGRFATIPFLECPRNLCVVLSIDGRLDVGALRAGVDTVVARHRVLRSRFRSLGGHPVRVIDDDVVTPCVEVDLRTSRGRPPESTIERAISDCAALTLDLTSERLCRIFLLHIGDDSYRLVMTFHHIVFDDLSRGVLAREWSQAYAAYSQGHVLQLPPLPASYMDYVSWQRERLRSEALQRMLEGWRTRVGAPSELAFTRHHLCGHASDCTGTWWFTIGSDVVRRLHELGRAGGVTVANILLGLWAALLEEQTGTDVFTIGIPIADRSRRQFEALVGLFMNVLVVRMEVAKGATFIEIIRMAQSAVRAAYAQRDLPYLCVLRQLTVSGRRAVAPYRVVFNFMSESRVRGVDIDGLAVRYTSAGAPLEPVADLTLHVRERGGQLSCQLVSRPAVASSLGLERLATRFSSMVQHTTENAEAIPAPSGTAT